MVPGECVGSGYCCKAAPCGLALARGYAIDNWKNGGAGCPALVWDEIQARYWCGLVLWETDEARKAALIDSLAMGAGCCSSMNSDRRRVLSKCCSPSRSFGTSSGIVRLTRSS